MALIVKKNDSFKIQWNFVEYLIVFRKIEINSIGSKNHFILKMLDGFK